MEQEELFDTEDCTPRVKRAATEYKKASEAKSKAGGAFNKRKENLIEVMKEDKCPRVAVELGGVRKIIRLDEKDVLKMETPKEAPAAGE